jgi:hypothetical protein
MGLPGRVRDPDPLDCLRACDLAACGKGSEPRDQADEERTSPHRVRG